MSITFETTNATLNTYIEKLDKYLSQDISELCINKPGVVFLDYSGQWKREDDESINMSWLTQFASVVATHSKQTISEKTPLLSTVLTNGLRIQIVMPPAVLQGTFAVDIRKPGSKRLEWKSYRESGAFDEIKDINDGIPADEKELLELKSQRDYEGFLRAAIKYYKNILVSGATSTGKTTFTNLLISEIPLDERLAIIEDSCEIQCPHENVVRLIYSKGNQGLSTATAEQLLECCLRLTPTRIVLGEIRGEEAYTFLDTIYSGHDGCITSMHASSPYDAFERLKIMIKKSEVGRAFNDTTLDRFIYNKIDVILQWKRQKGRRYISDIYYNPELQRKMRKEHG